MGAFAYYDADTDSTIYHVIPSPDSESAPSTIYSETESAASWTTIQSDNLPGYFTLHHGRQQPASDNVARWFPSDNTQRYVIRYLTSKSVFGGDYVGPVKQMLTPVEGRERQVLELGTRTGTWIQAMATEFPRVQFHSLDVVPMMPHVPRSNVTFEVYDFTEGLLLEDESQDAVFLNIILEMVKDYRSLLLEVYRVLRPGGLIHINDFNPHLWDPENTAIPARRTNPRGCHLFDLVRQRISSIGIDPDTCDKLPQWLAPSSDLWDQGQRGFKNVQSIIRTYPAYPHDGFPCVDQIDPRISPFLRHLTVMSARDMSGLLKDGGMSDDEAKKLIEDKLEELSDHERSVVKQNELVLRTNSRKAP